MFEKQQFDLLRSWLIAATEIPEVIPAMDGGVRPTTDYMVLNLIQSNRIHEPIDTVYEPTGGPDHPQYAITIQEYEFVWSLHTYSSNPINVTNRIHPWKKLEQGRELLYPLNMFKIGSVLRVPERVEQNWNDRATTELFVRSYVCTGTTDYDTDTVLIGRVPTDVIDIVTVAFPDWTLIEERT